MAVFSTARVRLFATHSHNPLVVYKAFQFAIILACLIRASPTQWVQRRRKVKIIGGGGGGGGGGRGTYINEVNEIHGY